MDSFDQILSSYPKSPNDASVPEEKIVTSVILADGRVKVLGYSWIVLGDLS